MGFFGKIASFAGAAAKKFGEVGRSALTKFGAIKSSYNSLNNAFGGAIARAIESIPIAGPLLKTVGQVLDNKATMGTLENVLDRSKVYGRDLERIGNKLIREER
jgi:hypothetical protein